MNQKGKTKTPNPLAKPRGVHWDDIEYNLGLDYIPHAPKSTLETTPYKDNLSFSMNVEDVLAQNLWTDPRLVIVVPTYIARYPTCFFTATDFCPDGKRIRAEIIWHDSGTGIWHGVCDSPSVRMNPKARLHIIVK